MRKNYPEVIWTAWGGVLGPSGVPDPKIEITPQMIEACVDVLMDYDPEAETVESTVVKILTAALLKRQ